MIDQLVRSVVEGGCPIVIRIRSGSIGEEQSDDVHLAAQTRSNERGPTPEIIIIHIRTSFQKKVDCRKLSARCGG